MRLKFPPGTLESVVQAIANWEEAVEWLVKGWDCIEEYTHDLLAREMLDDAMAEYSEPLSAELLSRITAADEKFRQATIESGLCVWHCEPQYRHMNGFVELCFVRYDPARQWYFFRWPPDAPYAFQDHDSYSYQKTCFGMDFLSMSDQELKVAACRHAENMLKRYAEIRGSMSNNQCNGDDK